MNIEIVGKDVQVSEMLKGRIEQKLGKIESRLDQKLFVRVRLSAEAGNRYGCAVRFVTNGNEFNATINEEDLVKAADAAIARLERQVRRTVRKADADRGATIRNAQVIA